MLTVTATRTIDARREDVFAFLDEPPNQVTVAPSLTGVADVQSKPDGGKRLFYGYAAFGIVFTGALETTVYDPPARIVFRMDGDITGEIRWELESLANDRTRFTYAADYDLSGLPGARLLRPAFRWYNRRELQTTVRNVERQVEQGPTTRADYLTDNRQSGIQSVSIDATTATDSHDAGRDGSGDTDGTGVSNDTEMSGETEMSDDTEVGDNTEMSGETEVGDDGGMDDDTGTTEAAEDEGDVTKPSDTDGEAEPTA